jgi:hypothetical protein
MSLGIDSYLDRVRDVLISSDLVPELVGTLSADLPPGASSDGNVMVYHFGEDDPSTDIQRGINRCKGVHVMITDMGGSADPSDADAPILQPQLFVDLYINPSMRSRKVNPDNRLPGEIRDDLMRCLHRHADLRDYSHHFYDATVTRYEPVADPDYVAWRIILARTIYLHA